MKNVLNFYREIPFSKLILMRDQIIDRDYKIILNKAIQDRVKGKDFIGEFPVDEQANFYKVFRRKENDKYQRR